MIAKAHRFHGLGSLRFVYSKGRCVRDGQVSLRYIDNKRRNKYRAAVVVSKKVSKSAVLRNRIRRRIYEIIRLEQSNIKLPYDMVFTVFSDSLSIMPAKDLNKRIKNLLKKAEII